MTEQASYVGWRVDVSDWQGSHGICVYGPAPERVDVPPPPDPPWPSNRGVVTALEDADSQGHLYQVEFDNDTVWSMYLPHPGVVLTAPGFEYRGVPELEPVLPAGPRTYADYTLTPLARVLAFFRRKLA